MHFDVDVAVLIALVRLLNRNLREGLRVPDCILDCGRISDEDFDNWRVWIRIRGVPRRRGRYMRSLLALLRFEARRMLLRELAFIHLDDGMQSAAERLYLEQPLALPHGSGYLVTSDGQNRVSRDLLEVTRPRV